MSEELRRAELLSRTAISGQGLTPELRAAAREACLLRVLRLRSFFFSDPRPEEGPVAADYLPDPERWQRVRPAPSILAAGALDELAEALRPIRPAGGADPVADEEEWPLLSLLSAVATVFNAFVNALPPERSGWFAVRCVH